MAELPKGYSIQTKNFKKVTVTGAKLGEGGQGAVYPVDYDGKVKVLKWYSGKKFKDPDKFYANLENNIKKGSPTKAFLWPEDITEHAGEAFGYIMDLRPPEFKDFSKILNGREVFASITAWTNAALQITAGFQKLHQKGYSYQDLNDGNFFIDPKNGNVLICDNDNVSEYGKNTGIAGKLRYMAPEIVLGKGKPCDLTDYFSLAVVLFLLWTNCHPLEGKVAASVKCLDAKSERRIYGENPVFIFDPKDETNIPVQGIHKGAFSRWPFLPDYLKDAFIKAFSKEVMKNPQIRIIEQDWLRLFIRMRSEVYKCSCGEIYFADAVNPNPCPGCKKKNVFPMFIKTQRYNVPVHQKTKLYTCHTEKSSDDYETLKGEVSANGSDYMLKNVSNDTWYVTDAGTQTPVASGTSFKLKKSTTINIGAVSIEVV
jgi:serine/threonine protein kinase